MHLHRFERAVPHDEDRDRRESLGVAVALVVERHRARRAVERDVPDRRVQRAEVDLHAAVGLLDDPVRL